jgi:hypothetical protein
VRSPETTRGCCRGTAPLESLSKKEVLQNYENRVRIMKQTMTEEIATATGSTKRMMKIVQSTSKYMVPKLDQKCCDIRILCETLNHM